MKEGRHKQDNWMTVLKRHFRIPCPTLHVPSEDKWPTLWRGSGLLAVIDGAELTIKKNLSSQRVYTWASLQDDR